LLEGIPTDHAASSLVSQTIGAAPTAAPYFETS
jgi:hypothetical protein